MRLLPALLALALAACDDAPPPPRPRPTRQERSQATQEALSKTPTPRTYSYPDGDLQVFDVPGVDSTGIFLERQKCYLWRDSTFKTATLSCPQPPEPGS